MIQRICERILRDQCDNSEINKN